MGDNFGFDENSSKDAVSTLPESSSSAAIEIEITEPDEEQAKEPESSESQSDAKLKFEVVEIDVNTLNDNELIPESRFKNPEQRSVSFSIFEQTKQGCNILIDLSTLMFDQFGFARHGA